MSIRETIMTYYTTRRLLWKRYWEFCTFHEGFLRIQNHFLIKTIDMSNKKLMTALHKCNTSKVFMWNDLFWLVLQIISKLLWKSSKLFYIEFISGIIYSFKLWFQ